MFSFMDEKVHFTATVAQLNRTFCDAHEKLLTLLKEKQNNGNTIEKQQYDLAQKIFVSGNDLPDTDFNALQRLDRLSLRFAVINSMRFHKDGIFIAQQAAPNNSNGSYIYTFNISGRTEVSGVQNYWGDKVKQGDDLYFILKRRPPIGDQPGCYAYIPHIGPPRFHDMEYADFPYLEREFTYRTGKAIWIGRVNRLPFHLGTKAQGESIAGLGKETLLSIGQLCLNNRQTRLTLCTTEYTGRKMVSLLD
jgi:hypothetical protein